MADPPPVVRRKEETGEPSVGVHLVEDSEFNLHTLVEIEEMKRSFLKKIMDRRQFDVAAEYRKEMEEDRIADKKNGHLVDELDSEVLLAPSKLKIGHLVDEREEVVAFAPRENQKNLPESPPSTLTQKSARPSRRSARVSQRVVAYESSLASRVSDESSLPSRVSDEASITFAENERRQRGSMAVVSPNAIRNLHGDRGVMSIGLVNTEKRKAVAVRGGKEYVSNSSFVAKNQQLLAGSNMHGVNAINDVIGIDEAAEMCVDAFNDINCNGKDLGVNAFIMEIKQQPSPLTSNFNTSGSMDEGVHVIGSDDDSPNIKCAHSPNLEQPNSNGNALMRATNQTLPQPFREVNHTLLEENPGHMALEYGAKSGLVNTHLLERAKTNDTTNLQSSSLPHGNTSDACMPRVLDVAPLSALHHDECTHLDLMEVRPLAVLQPGTKLPCGPSIHDSCASAQPPSEAQVSSLLSPSYSLPIPSPNFPPGTLFMDPAEIYHNSLAQKLQPITPNSISNTDSSQPNQSSRKCLPKINPHVNAATPNPPTPPLHQINPNHPHVNASAKSWVDVVYQGQNLHANSTKITSHDQPSHQAKPIVEQPQIFFGRSMADVLKSGQPADGLTLNPKP